MEYVQHLGTMEWPLCSCKHLVGVQVFLGTVDQTNVPTITASHENGLGIIVGTIVGGFPWIRKSDLGTGLVDSH